jgi:hypothetical protein
MENVSLIDLKKEKVRKVGLPDESHLKKLYVFERVFTADVIINVAKTKTIISAQMSMGMKNLKGLIRDDSKKQCHYTNLHSAIVDINRLIKPDITIIEGLVGCSLFDPIEHGVLLAGEDVVALDAVAALCVGVDPKTVKYLCMAEQAGLGVMDMGKIQIFGDQPETVRKEYQRGKDDVHAFFELYPEIVVSAGGACSGCMGVMESVLRTGKAEGWLKPWEGKLRFAIGPDAELPDDGRLNICLGNCLSKRGGKNFVKGCTYLMWDVKSLLESY